MSKKPFSIPAPNVAFKVFAAVAVVMALLLGVALAYNQQIDRLELESNERERLQTLRQSYASTVEQLRVQNAALAAALADRNDLRDFYLADDRVGLYTHLSALFQSLRGRYRIQQVYFIQPEGVVFLRLHDRERSGDGVTYRLTVLEAMSQQIVTSGLELSFDRMGVGAVAPVIRDGRLVYLVEVVTDYDQDFLSILKSQNNADYTFWLTFDAAVPSNMRPREGVPAAPISQLFFHASSNPGYVATFDPQAYLRVLETGQPQYVFNADVGAPNAQAALLFPLVDYRQTIIGVGEVSIPRESLASLGQNLAGVGLGALLASGILLWLVLQRVVLRPINRLEKTARRHLEGDLTALATGLPNDELGRLGESLNTLSLQLANQMRNQQAVITQRTTELTLAADIGRLLTVEDRLEDQLSQAVNLICDRFDLYYVQVFLVDNERQVLTLQAGSGEMGQQLYARGLRLPISPGSINGTAAASRQTVLVSDTEQTQTFRANPFLPDTRSEMALPLVARNVLIGVLDLQSARVGGLNADNQTVFEVLAAQVAVAIERSLLTEQARQASQSLAEQSARLMRQNWNALLDAVHQPRHLGYTFDGDHLRETPKPTIDPAQPHILSTALQLGDFALGTLLVEAEPDRRWTEDDRTLIHQVAQQVIQHVENLRLLAESEQARATAEQASRRLVREAWQAGLLAQAAGSLAFVYDQNQVHALTGDWAHMGTTRDEALSAPLLVRNEAIGDVALVGVADPLEAQALMNAVSSQLSAHIENLRLLAETEQSRARVASYASRLQDLQDILRTLSREVEPDLDAFHVAMVGMAGLLQAKFSALGLIDDEGAFSNLIHYGMDEATVRQVGDMPKGRGLLGAFMQEGLALRIRDITQDARAVGFPEHHPTMRSFLGVPLIFQEKVQGRIYFTESLSGEFSSDDEALAISFASSLSGVLQSAHLLRRIRTRAQELETVATIGTATATILNPQDLLQTVVDLAKANFKLYHAHIYLLNEAGDALVLTAGAGEIGRRMVGEVRTIPMRREQSLVAQAARSRQPVAVNNVLQDPNFLPNPYLPDTHAELAVPVISGDQVLGVLDVQSERINRFAPEDLNIITVLATQVGGALQNARAFAAADAAKQVVNAFYEASASFNLVVSYGELLDALVANSVLGRAENRVELLLLAGADTLAREAYWTASGESLPRQQSQADSHIVAQALQARDTQVFVEADARVLASPLIVAEATIGLVLGWFSLSEPVTEDDVRNLNGISGQAAVVAQNLRNLDLIRQRAEDLARLTRAQQALSQATDERQMVAGLAGLLEVFDNPVVSLVYYHANEAGQVTTVDVMAVWAFGGFLPDEMVTQLRHLPVTNFPMARLIQAHANEIVEIADEQTDPRLDEAMRQQAREQQLRTAVCIPLRTAGRWHGVLILTWTDVHPISERERIFYRELLEPMAATVATRRAYVAEEAARRANEKRVVELNLLAQMEKELSSAVTEAEIMLAFASLFSAPPLPIMLALYYLETDANDWPVASVTQALWHHGALVRHDSALGRRAPLDDSTRRLWVNQPNRYIHLPDVNSDSRLGPEIRAWAQSAGFTSMCILPLRAGARWQGLMLIFWDFPHELTESEHFLLGQVVEPLAANVASRRAYVQEQRTLRDVETLYRLSVQLTQAQSFQEMLRQCLEPVNADGAALFSFDTASQGTIEAMTLTAAYNQRGAVLLPEGTRLEVRSLDLNPVWSADTEAPFLVGDASQPSLGEATRSVLQTVRASRAALLPLTAEGRLSGMMVLRWPTPASFEERDEIFYRTLATRLSLAVENRTLLLQTQKRASELAAIAQISVAVTTLLDMRDLLQTVADLTQQNFDLYHAEVYQLDPHTAHLQLVAASGDLGRRALAAGPWTLPPDSSAPAARAVQARQGLFINDLRQHSDVPQHPLLDDVRAELAQPLLVGDTILGVLALKARRVGRFSQDDLAIKATLAAQVAVAVQNARLYEQARKRAERERQAFEIGQKIQATNSVEAALQTAIRELGQAYHARQTAVRLNK